MVKFYRQVPGRSMEKLVLADHSVGSHRMAILGIALQIPFYRQKRVCTLQNARPGLQPLNFKGDDQSAYSFLALVESQSCQLVNMNCRTAHVFPVFWLGEHVQGDKVPK